MDGQTMRVTRRWLEERLKSNPALSVCNNENNSKIRTVNGAAGTTGCEAACPDTQKPSKYRNTRVYVYEQLVCYGQRLNGVKPLMVFDSVKEYERWNTLVLLQRGGVISQLRRQVPLLISEQAEYKGQLLRKTEYNADFMYVKGNETIVEDVKAFDEQKGRFRTTETFNLKWKLLKKRYPNYTFLLV